MNELRAHPLRLLTILVAALMAFTTAYAVGSYGDTGTSPPDGAPPAAAQSSDPSALPVVSETPTAAPSGSTAPSGGAAPSGDGGGTTAPAQTTTGDAPDGPEPTRQPAQQAQEPAPADTQPDEPEPAPATSTYVATPDDQATHTCGASHDETCH